MKRFIVSTLSLSIGVLTACQSQTFVNTLPQTRPIIAQETSQAQGIYGSIQSQLDSSKQASLKFKLFYPRPQNKTFKTAGLDCTAISTIKVTIEGIGISAPIFADGADGAGHIAAGGCTLTATVSGVPVGNSRLATVEAFDGTTTLIPGSMIRSAFNITSGTSAAEISYRTTPVGSIVQEMLQGGSPTPYLSSTLDLSALNTFIDTLTGVTGSPGTYTYTNHPYLINAQTIASDLQALEGDVSQLNGSNPAYSSSTGFISGNLNDLEPNDNIQVNLRDPGSNQYGPLNVGGTSLGFFIPNTVPGNWTVELVNNTNGQSQTLTNVAHNATGIQVNLGWPVGQWVRSKGPESAQVNDIEEKPGGTNILYVATEGGGVFKRDTSVNNDWNPINNGLGTLNVRALASDPAVPSTIYAGVAGGNGVYKSIDEGANWTAANTGLPVNDITTILVDDTTIPSRLYAGTNGDGVYESIDSGANWSAVNTGAMASSTKVVRALELDPGAGPPATTRRYYAVVEGSGFLTTSTANPGDAGSWQLSNGSGGGTLANLNITSMTRNGFAVHVGTDNGQVYESASIGGFDPWINVSTGLSSDRITSIVNDSFNYYTGHNGSVFHSTNPFGSGWSTADASSQLYNKQIQTLLQQSGIIYAGTKGGVFSYFAGNWMSLNNFPLAKSLAGARITALVLDPADQNKMYAAVEGDSVHFTSDAGNTWISMGMAPLPFEVTALAVDPQSGEIFAGTDGQGIFKSNFGPWTTYNDGTITAGLNITSMVITDEATNNLYIGTQGNGIFKTPTNGISGTQMPGTTGNNYYSFAVKPGDPLTLYSGSDSGAIYKTSDGGGTPWSTVTATGSTGTITHLNLSAATPTTLYASSDNGSGGVYKSTNEGTGWSNITTGLPVTSMTGLAVKPSDADEIYVSMGSNGVYKSIDGGSNWNAYMTALPGGASMNHLVIWPNSAKMFAGSLGMSVFKVNL